MGDEEIGFFTSRLKSWSTGLLRTGAVLSEKPRDQLALPPFVGFPPGMKQDRTSMCSLFPHHCAASCERDSI